MDTNIEQVISLALAGDSRAKKTVQDLLTDLKEREEKKAFLLTAPDTMRYFLDTLKEKTT